MQNPIIKTFNPIYFVDVSIDGADIVTAAQAQTDVMLSLLTNDITHIETNIKHPPIQRRNRLPGLFQITMNSGNLNITDSWCSLSRSGSSHYATSWKTSVFDS
jgi:hypothetical protein